MSSPSPPECELNHTHTQAHPNSSIMPAEWETSSLYSLPDSLRDALYRFEGDRRFQSLNSDYT